MTHNAEPSHFMTVGDSGRVVIPADLRRSLGIGPGDTLVARVEAGPRLVLEDRKVAVRRLRGVLRPHARRHRSTVEELLIERRAEADLENAKISGDEAAITRAREALTAGPR
ncbi:MAG: AbrB/MazE/SpoVT family DNA-binding domain-containing protein [Acidimicrobiales bacterium]